MAGIVVRNSQYITVLTLCNILGLCPHFFCLVIDANVSMAGEVRLRP